MKICRQPLVCDGKRSAKKNELKPWKTKEWVIPPEQNSAFVAQMEQVQIVEHYPSATKIRMVLDNLKTHSPAALYGTFAPQKAKALWDRLEFIYTPVHGSWLNIAEIELRVTQWTMSEPAARQHRKSKAESGGVAKRSEQQKQQNQLAVHHPRCTH